MKIQKTQTKWKTCFNTFLVTNKSEVEIFFLTLWSRCGDKFVGETARTLDKCIQVGICIFVRI